MLHLLPWKPSHLCPPPPSPRAGPLPVATATACHCPPSSRPESPHTHPGFCTPALCTGRLEQAGRQKKGTLSDRRGCRGAAWSIWVWLYWDTLQEKGMELTACFCVPFCGGQTQDNLLPISECDQQLILAQTLCLYYFVCFTLMIIES